MNTEQEQQNIQIVKDFFVGWSGGIDNIVKTFEKFFAEDCVWENLGLPTCYGRADAITFMRAFHERTNTGWAEVIFRNIVAKDNFVFTERIDNNLTTDGEQIGPGLFPVLGIWELRDGRIKAWRDYFDPRPWAEAFPDADKAPGLGNKPRSGLL